ncbi:hypothetical protein [Dellaglioa algida]|uniref:hypothetical protein n=1 Tax=Dellaglioa algida TaxID=105612 RepID=UPI000BC74856|nr:hypothetical protein [Dellaglioa algida]MDK1717917.1 hypothetical protein [Dellaglioa algida]MDK1729891.1 hypothetical protein [Dellaglioa algida]MDK1742325.1 hypothetical protein [Dellaglioa algida]SOB49068.1 hypothetical protein LALCM10_10015 [Dellaglioa algida]
MDLKQLLDQQTYEILTREYGLHDAYIDAMTYENTGDSELKSNIRLVIKLTDYEDEHLKIDLIFEEIWRINYNMDLNTYRYVETGKPVFGEKLGQILDSRVDYSDQKYTVTIRMQGDYRLVVSAKKFRIETRYLENK